MYWSINKAMTYDPYILFVVGERGVGKSYSAKTYVIKRFLKHGEEFIYLRRYADELKKIDKFFDDVQQEFPDVKFEVKGKKFYINDVYAGESWMLSKQHYLKSTPFPKVHTIIFDEFIIDDGGFKRYIPNEVIEFFEVVQSILRYRNGTRTILLSNALSINNPYFMFLNIQMNGERFQIIKKARNGKILYLVEDVKEQAYREMATDSYFGQAIEGTAYFDYAINNKMLRDNTAFIKKKSPTSNNILTIIHGQYKFSIWDDYDNDGNMYIVDGMVNRNIKAFVINADQHDPTRLFPSRNHYLLKAIANCYRSGVLYFDSEVTYARFKDVLYLIGCK